MEWRNKMWTMNTWGTTHQNAAVFMRIFGPLVRAPQRVMRRKRRVVVMHAVYRATAKDGAVQPLDQSPSLLLSLLIPQSLLQNQCKPKFLPPPSPTNLCLSVPECIYKATWELNPWFAHSPPPLSLLLCLIEGRR